MKELIDGASEVHFNVPKNSGSHIFEDVLGVISSNDYSDIILSTDNLHIGEKTVRKVFTNLGRNGN